MAMLIRLTPPLSPALKLSAWPWLRLRLRRTRLTLLPTTYGPVVCLTGATVAAIVYGGDTAGEPVETAGTKSAIAGFNESATVLFVRPRLVDLS
jgi:hypothetical protein